MYEYRILSRLKKYANKNKTFHMPGHKGRGDFGRNFKVAGFDVTELSYSDNLHSPDGVILEAQRDLAEITGAKQCFITTDGSSSGVFAMLYAASYRGNKVIVMRNSHRSVWNACAVLGLEPLVVQGVEREGMLLPPDPALIEQLIVNDINISAALITSPDYYGAVMPLKEYAAVCAANNRLLLVDGAHGAHLAFEGSGGGYAGEFADVWVDGAHKTLPVLTQGALVCVNNEKAVPLIEKGLGIFRTTSPSYPVMASVEYGYKYIANNREKLESAKAAVASFREDISGIFPLRRSDDWAKITIDCKPLGVSADRAAALLEKRGVYPELSDGRNLLFYLSPMVRKSDLRYLKFKLLTVLKNKKLRSTYEDVPSLPRSERAYSYLYALKQPFELIPLQVATGRMCAENAGFTPPCIPVVVAGEIITRQAVEALLAARHTFGVTDGCIRVVKR